MCPLALLLKKRGFCVRVLATGQHGEMLYSALDFFGVMPDYNLDSACGTLADITEKVMRGTREVLEKERVKELSIDELSAYVRGVMEAALQ